jgi:hypothetical protein
MSESTRILMALVASADRAGLHPYLTVRRQLPHVPREDIERAWEAVERERIDSWWRVATAEIDVTPLQNGEAE